MRPVRLAAALALAAACIALGPVRASADEAPVPGTMSTTAVNTTRFDIPVPPGVVPRAITGVLTMPEVVNNGVVTFRVNGRIARTVPSTLYAKVRIPVTAADVIANGTIGLTMASQGPAIGGICRPAAGEASLRKIALSHRGEELAPTTLAEFFPPASARIDVLVPPDADAQVLEAGLTAVVALTARYGADTPIELNSLEEIPGSGAASQRIVVITAGTSAGVTTLVTAGPSTGGVPTLTLAGTGAALTAAARDLGVVGMREARTTTGRAAPTRAPHLEHSLEDFGVAELALSGYGTNTHRVRLLQDVFGTTVTSMVLRLRGTSTALSDDEQARVDVRVGGELVGSSALDETGRLDLQVTVPERLLGPAIDLDLVLSATTADGTTCAAAGVAPVQVDIDTAASTVSADPVTPERADFGLYPALLQGVLPLAIRPQDGSPLTGVPEAGRLVAALQSVAAAPLDIQLVRPETLVADDRSGLLVGATEADALTLGAPALLSSIRPVSASALEITSPAPYAVLQAVADRGRFVLMLGGWAPDSQPVPPALLRSVVDFATTPQWSPVPGDMVIADEATAPVAIKSEGSATSALSAEPEADESFPVLWVAVVAAVLVQVLAFLLLLRRRERRERGVAGAAEAANRPWRP